MKNENYLDERMLRIRGTVFMHSFMGAIGLLVCNAFVQDVYGPWAAPFFENLLMAILLITFTSMELIARNVYTGPPATMRFAVSVIFITGLALLALTIFHASAESATLWQAGRLTRVGANGLMSGMFLAVAVGYVIRQKINKRQDNTPDEE